MVVKNRGFYDTETAVASQITAGRDVSLDAGQDLTIEGGRVRAQEDATLTAGRDIAIASAANSQQTSSSSSSMSASFGVGATASAANGMAAGAQVSASATGSESDFRADSNTNAEVSAGQDLTVKSGQDTVVAGANLEGDTVFMDVGGDLTVASRQDTSDSKSSNWSIGGTATVGAGASAGLDIPAQTGDSANIGTGKGSGSTAWVNQQTSIIGREQVDIRVEGNTHIEGAVIAAENGNLKLDTDTLTYQDIHDHDKAENQQASLSGSISAENEKNNERTTGEDGNPYAGTAEGSYSAHDRQQITRATIGEGEIIIRSDPAAGLEGLNRDLAKAQEITKDKKTSVTVYIDSSAITEVASGGAGIVEGFEKTGEVLQKLANEFQAITASLPPEMKHLGEAGLTAMQSMIRANVPDDAIAAVMNDEQFQKVLTKAADLTEYLKSNSDLDTDLSTRSLSKTSENGDVIAIISSRKTLGTQFLDLLIETQRFIDGIPYKEEAQIALIGLQVALGGPVKTAVSVVNNVVLDSLVGDKIEQLSTAVATEIAAILGYGKDSTQIAYPPSQEDIEAAKLGLSLAIGSVGTVVAGKAVIADMTKSVAAFRKIGIEEVVEFDAKTIRFTQDSISNKFKDGTSVKGLIDDLKSGKVSSDDIPPIRVFEKDGKYILLTIGD